MQAHDAQLLTIEQAAHVLNVSPKVVRRLVKEGKLPSVALTARNTRIPTAAVFALSAPPLVPDVR
jgi:excisionase family DNA binding protein